MSVLSAKCRTLLIGTVLRYTAPVLFGMLGQDVGPSHPGGAQRIQSVGENARTGARFEPAFRP